MQGFTTSAMLKYLLKELEFQVSLRLMIEPLTTIFKCNQSYFSNYVTISGLLLNFFEDRRIAHDAYRIKFVDFNNFFTFGLTPGICYSKYLDLLKNRCM